MCDMCRNHCVRAEGESMYFWSQFYYQKQNLVNPPSPSASHSTSWCYSTLDLGFVLFLTTLVSSTDSTSFLKSVFVLCPLFCVSINHLSCVLFFFALPHLVSCLSSWLTVFSWLFSSFAAVFVLTVSCIFVVKLSLFFPPNLLKLLYFPFRPIRLHFWMQHLQAYIWNTPTNICSPIKNAAFWCSESLPL